MNTRHKTFQTFDPNPSLKLALELLSQAGVTQFALIGKLAMWVYLEDESQHGYTKDVDFAVLLAEVGKIEQHVLKQGLPYQPLHIGGIGIRAKGLNIDFIDRRLHGVEGLFREAIQQASQEVFIDDKTIPVVSLEHLIAMKMVSGEPKDDQDLKTLLALHKADYSKARKVVETHLGLIPAERLDVFAREAGILPKTGPYIETEESR